MIDEVLGFWFGAGATDVETYERQMRRWFMDGPALDAEIRDRFGALVERALAGELDDWASTIRGRLALILVLDQLTRSLFRGDPRTYAGDAKAQALAAEAFAAGLDRELGIEERHFLMMPFVHAEDLGLQERAVALIDALAAEAPAWRQPVLAIAQQVAHEYRDIITRFGRFPHRNALLGRRSTRDEEEFLVDWEARMRRARSADLPS